MGRRMSTGPVEYIIVGIPGNQFTGEIAPELIALVKSGTVRILDLIFIGKDADGAVVSFEIDELDELAGFSSPRCPSRRPHQPRGHRIRRRGQLEPNSSAALLDLGGCVGPTPFAEAVRRSGGVLLEGARIPHELIEPRYSTPLPPAV